jgi:hypothetical protein
MGVGPPQAAVAAPTQSQCCLVQSRASFGAAPTAVQKALADVGAQTCRSAARLT